MIATSPGREQARWMLRESVTPKRRTMRQFAEQEIVIPNGRYQGSKFRVRRQPFTGLWLDAVDSGRWMYHNTTGPTQTGKTLLACGVPLCYHLFEIGETVIFALPDMDMADDKWREDILPIVAHTRYADWLPTKGEGSRGGKVKNAVTFANGSTLKFMTGGASGEASDKGRAGYTSRVLIVTEKSAFGTAGESSSESSKLEQLRARTMHYGSQARIYEESTLTTDQDATWTDLKAGTDSKIVHPCPHCRQYVSPEREHLRGWQDAPDVLAAKELATFVCPACETPLSEDDRAAMNAAALLLHNGQEITPAGEVTGKPVPTDTLGFRWSAFQNLFRTAGDVGADEWRGRRATNEDDAEKKLRQFVWCLPYSEQIERIAPLTREGIINRQANTPRGLVPKDASYLSVGLDLGQSARTAWWTAIAWLPNGSSVVIDYGHLDILSDTLGVERAVLLALTEFRDHFCEKGWAWEEHPKPRPADAVFIDSAWRDTVVYQFVRLSNELESTHGRYWPTRGFGDGQFTGQSYTKPRKTGGHVTAIGDNYHIVTLPAHGVQLVEINADHWKMFVQQRLSSQLGQDGAPDEPGTMRLFSTVPSDHNRFAKMILSERPQVEFKPDKGEVLRWKKQGENHLLDATSNGSAAGHFVGVRVAGPAPVVRLAEPETPQPRLTTPDGRPFFIMER